MKNDEKRWPLFPDYSSDVLFCFMSVDTERAPNFHMLCSFKGPIMDENLGIWRFTGWKSSKTFPCLLVKHCKQLALHQQNSAHGASGKFVFPRKFLGCQQCGHRNQKTDHKGNQTRKSIPKCCLKVESSERVAACRELVCPALSQTHSWQSFCRILEPLVLAHHLGMFITRGCLFFLTSDPSWSAEL